MAVCSKCGFEVVEGAAFCSNCGAGQVQQVPAVTEEVKAMEDTRMPEIVAPVPVWQPEVQPTPEAPATLTGPAKIFSIISMACGIVSLVSSYGGILPAVAALVFSKIATSKAPNVPNTMAKVGKITGIIGIVVSVLWIVIAVVGWLLMLIGASASASYSYLA